MSSAINPPPIPAPIESHTNIKPDARYKAERRERRQRREEARRQGLRGQSDSSSYDDDTTDEDKTPLALEAPPEDQPPLLPQAQSRAPNVPNPEPVRK